MRYISLLFSVYMNFMFFHYSFLYGYNFFLSSLTLQIFYLYTQHRSYVVDEVIQLLWKLPFSKRAARAYHLSDEEQKQIQMVTALLLQLVLHSANLPEVLRQTSNDSSIFETPMETNYMIKCNEAAREACVSFWTHVLERLTSKSQDSSEVKVILENLVVDLLTTLNLPEYPAASLILEVRIPLFAIVSCFYNLPHLKMDTCRSSVSCCLKMLVQKLKILVYVLWQLIYLVQLLHV